MSDLLARTVMKSAELQIRLHESTSGISGLHDMLSCIMVDSEDKKLTGDALARRLGVVNNLMAKVIKAHNNARLSMMAAIEGYEQELKNVATDEGC